MHEHEPYQYFEDVNLGLLRLWGRRSGRTILDVGCGFATTSQLLQRDGNLVTGIEASDKACAVAASRIGRVVQANLLDYALLDERLGESRFDVILFADVLEHLPWPLDVLRHYLRWLEPDGSVIISLPNVGLWSVRLAHLIGRWEYEETGVLDRTHLRFFTISSAARLLAAADLNQVARTWNPGLVRPFVPLVRKFFADPADESHDPAAILHSRPYQLYLRSVYPVERLIASVLPGMLAFQMIFEARRNG